ncbi:MAG: SbcC/MukB-like Walker B domain-containing protein [Pseudomonadota bacterium]
MKVLKNIRLVQFYLFEKEDLPISHACGIFGPNGSGKSAFIDALQIVMTGANQNYMAFNAQADETKATSRSIRSYCLGQTGEADAGRVRDAATTYLTLVWEDEASGEPTSMGICITASADSEKHFVEGRYLLPGVALTLDDHLEMAGRTQRPQDWKVFRKELERRAQGVGYESEVVFTEPLRFVRAYLTALRGSGAIPHAESFLRAFRFGLKMRFDKPVDEIVRHQVLEQQDTPIRRFKEVMESFRSLRNRVIEIEEKINDAEGVAKLYSEAAKLSSQVATWEALAAKGRMLDAAEHVAETTIKLQRAQEALTAANEKQAQHLQAIEQAEAQTSHYSRLVREHASYTETRDLQALIEQLDDNLLRGQMLSARHIGTLQQCLQLIADKPTLNPQAVDVTNLVNRLGELKADSTAPSVATLTPILVPTLRIIDEAFKVASEHRGELSSELKQFKANREQVKENLQRIQSGKPPLSRDVLHIQRVLGDNGIPCTPVCDIVSVTDSSWQPVIEAFLGPHLEALLIKDQEKLAFSLYRQQPGIYGVKLVRESRHSTRDKPPKGSVAELLQGEHLAAVEYLRTQFGRTMQADTDEAAITGERTLTRDGMLTGWTIDRLRPVPAARFLLGANNRAAQRDELLTEDLRLERAINAHIKDISIWKDYCDRFAPFISQEQFKQEVFENLQNVHRTSEQLSAYKRQFSVSADEEYFRLCTQENEWREKLTSLRHESSSIDQFLGGTKTTVNTLAEKLDQIQGRHESTQRQYDVLLADRAYDPDFARAQWDELVDIQRLGFLAAADAAESSRRTTDANQRKYVDSGGRKLAEFRIKYSISLPEDTVDWNKAHVWIRHHLDLLRSTELEQYKEKMEVAFQTSKDIFRNDVALAINNNLDWLRSFQDRLNTVLDKAPDFSNGEHYRFVRHERKEHSELLAFIRNVKQWGTQNDLAGVGEMPDAFRILLEESTSNTATARGPLDDYREFFDFDIEIYRRTADGKAVTLGRLSRRIGTGSGGEHRAPLYVIAGAALANAYHLTPSHRDGLGLIVLDEAFNKMDPNNITSTMQYLDALGLQVMMASPGENLGTLTAFLHSYFDIVRDAETNVVKLSHREVSEGTRELFRSDLLEFHPELLMHELETMQANRSGQSESRP